MMEASVAPQDSGHANPLTGALDTSSPLPSPQPVSPARPCRPRPPPPIVKPSQLPSRPPLPPSTPPSLPPPLPPVSKAAPTPAAASNPPPPSAPPPVSFNPPPPSLPPPLSPTPASPPPSPQASAEPAASPLCPPLSPSSSASSPPLPPPSTLTPASSPAPPPSMSLIDQLIGSASVWQTKGLSPDQISGIMGKEMAGAFLVHSTDDKGMTLSVRLPEEQGGTLVRNLAVKQHKTFLHIDGSALVFDDVFKLICFYCVSRDVLPVPLRLPEAIATTTKKEELEVIAAMAADFWTSKLNQPAKDDQSPRGARFLYVNPVSLEESPCKSPKDSFVSKSEILPPQSSTSSLQNGEASQKVTLEVKGQTKSAPSQEIKYKRPPPRPPSLSSGSGMGLLFSSPPSPHNSSSLAPAAEKKEEEKGGGGEREERKSASTSPPPSRPPVPPQSRSGPPLPPAPLRRTSSRKGSDREGAERTEREKGQNPAKEAEKEGVGEGKTGSKSAAVGEVTQLQNCKPQDDEVRKEGERAKGREDDEKGMKVEKEEEKQAGSHGQLPAKRPSRPVPPPRRKPSAPDASQAAGVSANQNAGMRAGPPCPARRPDVSLYSPQGGAALGADPDSCSTSSTEEEAEQNQEPEQNHNRPSESSKVTVKRTPTTVILDRARYRLSTVITGLISHDRRLTQRIVELARDPLSYFGNLVKEHRAFTLETMSNHSTSTELLQEIRQMMTQLKSYLLQSTELHAMLEPQHQYAQDKLESIVEAALCKSVLKPLREPIYQSLEKLHVANGSQKQLTQNQSVVLGSTTTALGVTTAVPEASAMEKISVKLNNLHLEYSPQRKIELLLKTCKIIYDSMSVSCPGRAHGADDFLPVMMYVLARSNLSGLQLDVEYMMELMDPALTLGEGSYYLTTTYGAIEHIKTFDQQRSATRQLSREVQDSIHRWERRRTLNQERMSQKSVQDFLTVCSPEVGANPKTLGVLPTTTIQQLTEQCAARFEQDSYILSIFTDGVYRPLGPTELAVGVKSSCQPGAYCFVYHAADRPHGPSGRSCPTDPPPAPPAEICFQAAAEAVAAAAEVVDAAEPETEEESLISL